jgi:hypothetical protein
LLHFGAGTCPPSPIIIGFGGYRFNLNRMRAGPLSLSARDAPTTRDRRH